ncbi:MAG: tetratricopeptide repeat protein [Gemmataceae bacterium]|nr:tetratricopeptide repeat protein [Gemmataceae bacterium]
MNTQRCPWILVGSLMLAVFGHFGSGPAGAANSASPKDQVQTDTPPALQRQPQAEALSADQAIQQLQDKIRDNPKEPLLHTLLAQMYIRQARETGAFAGYERAEAALRRALELDKDYLMAQATWVQVLCAGHQFAEGLRLAQQLYEKNPGRVQFLMLIGDAHLELGQYAEAEKAYQELQRKDPLARLLSRQARLAELKGKTTEALRLMQQAAEEEAWAALSPEGRAWYRARLGEMHFNAGHVEEAAKQYQAALKTAPRYHVALAGLGRVRAAQGKSEEAIELYRQALVTSADLALLAELGDLCAQTGKDYLAQLNYKRIEQAATAPKVGYYRELALFYCNQDCKLPEALELARKDLEVRRDIYAFDTLAWALYKNQRFQEAAAAMTQALRLGTRDAQLYYHAGMIYDHLGQKEKAREYLERALALNPHFSVLQAEVARRTLKALP